MLVGLSKDSVDSHRRFAEKHGIAYWLLADPDGAILALLGVESTPGGRARRTTFVIDKAGIVRNVFENVSARGHAEVVLSAVRALA